MGSGWIPDRSQIEPRQTRGRSQTNPGQIPGRPQTDSGWIPDSSQANPQKGLRTDPRQIPGWIPKGSWTDAELARGFGVLRLFPTFPQLFLDDTKVKNFITCFKGTRTPPKPPQTPSPGQHGSPPSSLIGIRSLTGISSLIGASSFIRIRSLIGIASLRGGGRAEPSAAGSGRGDTPHSGTFMGGKVAAEHYLNINYLTN